MGWYGRRLRPLIGPRVLWDAFMVCAALVNLYLILFDLTYLWLRPVYFRHLPVVTRVWDPVKGIEPHPLTEQLLDRVDTTLRLLETDENAPELPAHLDELRTLFVRVLLENPFERSGQTRFFETFKQELARQAGLAPAAVANPDQMTAAVHLTFSGAPERLRARLARFNASSRSSFELAYFRELDRNGRLTDHFWVVDLPFLTLFWVEFLVRWLVALRRRTYARWFFFPIFNWYDLLGLIPLHSFRVFRLVRAASMYLRLRRAELPGVGSDPFSRAVAYLSSILAEEVSDRVALRILGELRTEISDGTHLRIIRDALEPRRVQITNALSRQIRELLTDPATIANLRQLVSLNLANAVDRSEALRSVPLPASVLRPLVRHVGEVVLDTALATAAATLRSEEGEEALQQLAAGVLEDVCSGPGMAEIESLAKEISLQLIDQIKAVVAVKKWAQAPSGQPAAGPIEGDACTRHKPDIS